MKQLSKSGLSLLAGLILGLAAYHVALVMKGQTVVRNDLLDEQQALLDRLQQENLELSEELFQPRGRQGIEFSRDELPYDEGADAASIVGAARTEAQAENRFLMVTFGANWCLDCRTLHHHINSEPVAGYTRDLFRFVYVDVGKLNQNRDVAESLGVSLAKGIPVAVFFDRNGELIGTTNEGQLEPARYYSSSQILKFVRDIAERNRIVSPDSVN